MKIQENPARLTKIDGSPVAIRRQAVSSVSTRDGATYIVPDNGAPFCVRESFEDVEEWFLNRRESA